MGNANNQFLQSLNANNIRKIVICQFNEGTHVGANGQGNPFTDNASPYMCKQTPSNTAGGTQFANALSTCPCHNQNDCNSDARCTWNAQYSRCHPSAQVVQGSGKRRASKYRSFNNGRIYTTFAKQSVNDLYDTQNIPPELAQVWNTPNGVRFSQGQRHYFVP